MLIQLILATRLDTINEIEMYIHMLYLCWFISYNINVGDCRTVN